MSFNLDAIFEKEQKQNIGNIYIGQKMNEQKIHYTKIKVNVLNRDINQMKVDSIAESIKLNGLLEKPYVTGPNNEFYTLWAGHHRLKAIELLVNSGFQEYEMVDCIILENNPVKNELLMLDSNLERAELSPYDTMMYFGRKEELLNKMRIDGVEVKGTLRDVIALHSGYRPTQVGSYLKIYKKGCKELKKALKINKVNLSVATKLASLSVDEQRLSIKQQAKQRYTEEEKYKRQMNLCIKELEKLKRMQRGNHASVNTTLSTGDFIDLLNNEIYFITE